MQPRVRGALVRRGERLAAAGAALVLVAGASAKPGVQQAGPIDLVAQAGARLDGAASDDRAGVSVASAGDLDGDGRPDLVLGASGADQNARLDSGSAYVVFASTGTGTTDLATIGTGGFRIDGALAGDGAGSVVAGAGDVNGDGRPDIVVGAELADAGGRSDSGSAYVIFGKATPEPVDLAALGQGGFRIDGATAGERAAGAVAGAGDVNGDGLADIVLGAARADNNERRDSGSAYVVFGRATTEPVDLAALGQGGFRMDGAAAGHRAGISVAGAGDMSGDGLADVVVGADGADFGGRSSGSAYVVFGNPAAETVDLAALGDGGFRVDGAASMLTGSSVDGAGDVNGDGRPDLVVGSPAFELFSGVAHIVFGSASTDTVVLASLGERGFRIDGATAGDRAGAAVAGVGDVNGDGRADVLVGADGDDQNGRTGSGSAYVVFGKATTRTVDVTALGDDGVRIDGAAAGDRASFSVADAGDLDRDGRGDLALGAPRADNNARTDSGSAYVVVVDTTAPRLTLRGQSRQRPLAQRGIVATATCDEPCRLSATGVVTIVGTGAAVRLQPASATLTRAGSRTLRLSLDLSARRLLARLLEPTTRAQATITVRALDRAGNASAARRTVAVRR